MDCPSDLLVYDVPADYPQDLKDNIGATLRPMELTFQTLTDSVIKAHNKIIGHAWTSKEVTS